LHLELSRTGTKHHSELGVHCRTGEPRSRRSSNSLTIFSCKFNNLIDFDGV
jgi:hypothetical protein